MKQQDLQELLELEKKFYTKLSEAVDLTQELDEAVDRQDQVTISLVLSMRQKPLLEMQEIQSYIDLKRLDLDQAELPAFDRLVGGGQAQDQDEEAVALQIQKNRRILSSLAQADRQVNQKVCGEESCYKEWS